MGRNGWGLALLVFFCFLFQRHETKTQNTKQTELTSCAQVMMNEVAQGRNSRDGNRLLKSKQFLTPTAYWTSVLHYCMMSFQGGGWLLMRRSTNNSAVATSGNWLDNSDETRFQNLLKLQTRYTGNQVPDAFYDPQMTLFKNDFLTVPSFPNTFNRTNPTTNSTYEGELNVSNWTRTLR
eukprot:TRINITY_DN12557_c0_g1_i1.p1 TRINITY_DN12557_c0_g1~~TRINITY_DN12557_c0_g1_i1.p1  ORF type:complete len:179 (-),score=20.47 TRINITY_DN12557_c0_g1_i1:5-541(-)